MELSPRLSSGCQTNSGVSLSLYISLHADLGSCLHMRCYFSDTDHQLVFQLLPEVLKLDCYLTPNENRFQPHRASVFL